ncbi:DUF1206 domain-containing protein [Phenylobacterium sp.]|uniref:DUF1206 domain-containing protein n=1 Tax=Phenylobacterium sp. TaxID=1871053 RepID=UPI002E36A196|nr:DUF1206 domain-containing protein [Phenylobacterium sp.]HEX2560965.1 DUF1206 domain-containing protein [Phenylobacterium sp.]
MNSIPRFETFTRLGFAARGLLYILMGYLAIEAGRSLGTSDVLRTMAGGGLGRVVLGLVGLGLLAYGAWRLAEAALDLEGSGEGLKGKAVRAGHGGSGVVHVLLGLLALGLTFGIGMGGGGGGAGAAGGGSDGAQTATAWVLGLPAGEWLVRLVAVGFIVGGLGEWLQAYKLGFLKQLDGRAQGRAWVKWIGRLGYAARGVLFILAGLFYWRAAATENPREAGGLGEALGSLSGWAQLLVAAGLVLFGVFSLVQAMYRRITNPQVVERLKGAAGRSGGGRGATRAAARRG